MCAIDDYPWKLGEANEGGVLDFLCPFSFRLSLRLVMTKAHNAASGSYEPTFNELFGEGAYAIDLLSHMEGTFNHQYGADLEPEKIYKLPSRYWKTGIGTSAQITNALNALIGAIKPTVYPRQLLTTPPSYWDTFATSPGSQDIEQLIFSLKNHGVILPFIDYADTLWYSRANFVDSFLSRFGSYTMRQLYTSRSSLPAPDKQMLVTSYRFGIVRCPRDPNTFSPKKGGKKRKQGIQAVAGNNRCCNNGQCITVTEPNSYCEMIGGICSEASDPCS